MPIRRLLSRLRPEADPPVVATPVADTPFAVRVRRRLDRLERRSDEVRAGLVAVKKNHATLALRVRRVSQRATATQLAVKRLEAQVASLTRLLVTLSSAGSATELSTDLVDVRLADRLVASVTAPAEAAALAELLVDLGHPLAAGRVAAAHDAIPLLRLPRLRVLARELRQRGFLAREAVVLGAAAELGGEPADRAWRLRQEEIAVLSGELDLRVAPFQVVPEPGRILHVVGFSLPRKQSGYTIRTDYLVRAQASAGLDPHVVTQVGIDDQPEAATEWVSGIPHHRLPGPQRSTLGLASWLQRDADELATLVARVRPQVLHAHSDFLNALAAEAVGRAAGIPVVYETRGFWEESWRSRVSDQFGWTDIGGIEAAFGVPEAYSWRREQERQARLAADHVITLARVMASRILASGLPESRLSLVPNAVDADAFADLDRDPTLTGELGIDASEVVIGYISSLVEYEGIDTLVVAFAALRATSDVPVRLLVVGDGPERAGLEALAAEVGSAGVTFTGSVPHDTVDRYYSLIDVFVVPRRPSDVCHLVTPLKPFEAFATGCAVVMSDVEALREIAEDCGAATLFTAGDAASLTRVLGELVGDPARRARLAEEGRAWVRAERSWQHAARVYLDVYERLGVTVPVS